MASAPVQFGEGLELDFKGKAVVRALMVNQMPFLSLPDILVACNYNEYGAQHVYRESFPAFGKLVARAAENPEEPVEAEDMVFLSPTPEHLAPCYDSYPERVEEQTRSIELALRIHEQRSPL